MTKTEEAGRTDPFEMWRQLYDTNERAWTAALEHAMGQPDFSDSSGKLLETMLAAQKSVRDNMRTYLETMNVPTREDIARLGELVVGLEEKVDQGADRLDAIEDAVRDTLRTSLETIKTMNLPTREDVARLGELVGGLDKKIDRRHAVEDAARAKAAASAKAATVRAAARAKAAAARAKTAAAKAKAAKAASAKAASAKPASAASTKPASAKPASTKPASAKPAFATATK
jgi:hypothetical protein